MRGHVTQARINAISFSEVITGQVQRHTKFVFRKTIDQNTWGALHLVPQPNSIQNPPTCPYLLAPLRIRPPSLLSPGPLFSLYLPQPILCTAAGGM